MTHTGSEGEWHHRSNAPPLHMPSYETGYRDGESSGHADWSLPFEEFLSIELKFDDDRGYKSAKDIVKVMNWMIKELDTRGVKIPDEFLEKEGGEDDLHTLP